ncbi:MAG: hypothetical protein K9W43_13575 [Candidatus Thorarchaeota archaeon]|nr:hypothetical protein [Candidatus Thorarchaeota archaeon]
MTIERNETIKSVLRTAAERGTLLRFFGPSMVILAEGKVAYVGNGIVAIKRGSSDDPEEFLVINSIIKIQKIKERQY